MRVQPNREYIYYPNLLDKCDGRTGLVPGSIVKVINLPGCPRANTMQHAHVEHNGRFAGMVHTNSLYSFADRQLVLDAMRKDLEKLVERVKQDLPAVPVVKAFLQGVENQY